MNRVIMVLFPLFGWLLFQKVLYASLSSTQNGYGAIASSQPGFLHAQVDHLAEALGAGQLSPQAFSIIVSSLCIYSLAIGHLTRILLQTRGFNRALNGTICLLGAFATLMAYAKIFGPLAPEHTVPLMIGTLFGSLAALFLACLLKAWLVDEAESIMTGTASLPRLKRRPKTRHSSSPIDMRLAAITAKNRK